MPGRKTYSTSLSRPRRSTVPSSAKNIADLFKLRSAGRGAADRSKMVPIHHEEDFSDDSQSAPERSIRGKSNPDHPLTLADMSVIAADIKATFSAALTDLKTSMLVLNEKMAATETAGKRRERAIQRIEKVNMVHAQHFIDMNRHLKDLDNRARRCNVRVRGIPESVDSDQIVTTLRSVFNSLLERQEDADIHFVRAHRELRPRGPDFAPPRDIICCLESYGLKEEIMRKARRNDNIVFNGSTIMLFQDLSQITLRNRRALGPLLEKLRERDLRYTWRFPIAFNVSHNGHQFTLHTPADLPEFCEALDLGEIELPDWYAEFLHPLPTRSPPDSPLSTPDKRPTKKSKQGRGGGPKLDTPRRQADASRDRAAD